MQSENIFLSVVIPAYNETTNFRKGALTHVYNYLKQEKYNKEVIIVDDGSEDETYQLLKNWIRDKKDWRIIRNPHKGKAIAVATGIAQSKGKYVLFTDFDQATPINEIEKLWPFMKKGNVITIGSREVKGSKREREPWYRHVMGRLWNFFVKIIAIGGIQDTQCGFKLFQGNVARELFDSLYVYKDSQEKTAYMGAFDVEVLYIAQKYGYQIAEVPVHWHHVRTNRLSPIRDSLKMLKDLFRIRVADFQGKYEKKH